MVDVVMIFHAVVNVNIVGRGGTLEINCDTVDIVETIYKYF